MKSPGGWVQGFNAQAAVNERGVILAAELTQEGIDVHQCQPMMAATTAALRAVGVPAEVGVMLFDAGYWSEANATAPGPDRLIATSSSRTLRKEAKENPRTGLAPPGATPGELMEHRLLTAEGIALYGKRSTTVEPVFGHIKEARGFRRFVRRGLAAASAEWQLIAATHNILKLFRSEGILAT